MRLDDYRVIPNFVSHVFQNKPIPVYGAGNNTRTFCYVTEGIIGFFKVLLSEFNGIDFVFHWNTNSPGIRDFTDVEVELTELSNRFNNLDLVSGTLDKEEYERLFNSVQGVVASYAPSSYKHKTSGVFWDVLRRDNCSLLCSNDTWLARESLALGESAYFFDYEDIASMIRAIKEWESHDQSSVNNDSSYKKMICKPFSEWVFSQFYKVE